MTVAVTEGSSEAGARLRSQTGRVLDLPGHRWLAEVDDADREILRFARAPVLDVGCGPGRHTEALARAGAVVLGIDLSSHAVDLCRNKGLTVLERSIFEHIPRAGDWESALLLDGNIGIGGNPITLLSHVRDLLKPGGTILVEIDEDPFLEPQKVCLEIDGVEGPWFDWIQLNEKALIDVAHQVGLIVKHVFSADSRRFAVLKVAVG